MSDHPDDQPHTPRLTRRAALTSGLALAAGAWAAAPAPRAAALSARQATPVATPTADQATAIVNLARAALAEGRLRSIIVRVLVAGREVVTAALGESMTGVPATPEMRFRNGAVTYSYMSTLLLRFVDQGLVGLDDSLATWLPDIPDADRATLRMLVNMTAGYPDYVQSPGLDGAIYANPFKAWTNQELLDLGLAMPRRFAPGENWDYSHTNFVLLGEALAKVGGQPLDVLLKEQVLDPMGLRHTVANGTAVIPDPVLHAFSSERRPTLGIPAGTPFYEESTYWDPSWTLPAGAVQTTNIVDLTTTMIALGEGTILSPASHQTQIDPGLLGFGTPIAGCANCRTMNEQYNYGLGIVLHGDWLLQNPLYGGYAGIGAYLPAQQLAVALAVTFMEAGFDAQGNYADDWTKLFSAIGAYLAPDAAPLSQ